MAKASDKIGILRQNLADAGCREETVKSCVDYANRAEWSALILLLAKHKAALLNVVHESQKQIDCLDFLIYQIRKEYE